MNTICSDNYTGVYQLSLQTSCYYALSSPVTLTVPLTNWVYNSPDLFVNGANHYLQVGVPYKVYITETVFNSRLDRYAGTLAATATLNTANNGYMSLQTAQWIGNNTFTVTVVGPYSTFGTATQIGFTLNGISKSFNNLNLNVLGPNANVSSLSSHSI